STGSTLGCARFNHVAQWRIWTMATYDFSPLFRSTIGFDRLGRLFDQALVDESVTYPPYNIEKTGEDAYRITMAVAGFGEDDISLVAQDNVLNVTGKGKAPATAN